MSHELQKIYTSTSPDLQHASRARVLHTSTSLRLTSTSIIRLEEKERRRSWISRYRAGAGYGQELVCLHLNIYTPVAHLQTSTPLGPQHASRAPDLLRQKEATPAAHRQSSRALEANTATYLRVTRPTAFLPSPRSLETKRGNTPAALLQTSCISRPAACLLSSRSPYLHVPAPAACLPS